MSKIGVAIVDAPNIEAVQALGKMPRHVGSGGAPPPAIDGSEAVKQRGGGTGERDLQMKRERIAIESGHAISEQKRNAVSIARPASNRRADLRHPALRRVVTAI